MASRSIVPGHPIRVPLVSKSVSIRREGRRKRAPSHGDFVFFRDAVGIDSPSRPATTAEFVQDRALGVDGAVGRRSAGQPSLDGIPRTGQAIEGLANPESLVIYAIDGTGDVAAKFDQAVEFWAKKCSTSMRCSAKWRSKIPRSECGSSPSSNRPSRNPMAPTNVFGRATRWWLASTARHSRSPFASSAASSFSTATAAINSARFRVVPNQF